MNLDVRLNIFTGTLAFIQNTGKDYLCTLFLNTILLIKAIK